MNPKLLILADVAGAAGDRNGEHVHERQQIDVVALGADVAQDPEAFAPGRVHPHVERVVHVVGREAVFADASAECVLAVGARDQPVFALASGGIAARAQADR